MLLACPFSKDMNEVQVEATILEAFPDKIPPLTDIEILTSVHTKLVKQTAPQQAGINGIILHRLFKNKPMYVGPSRVLLPDLLEVSLFYDSLSQNSVGNKKKGRTGLEYSNVFG